MPIIKKGLKSSQGLWMWLLTGDTDVAAARQWLSRSQYLSRSLKEEEAKVWTQTAFSQLLCTHSVPAQLRALREAELLSAATSKVPSTDAGAMGAHPKLPPAVLLPTSPAPSRCYVPLCFIPHSTHCTRVRPKTHVWAWTHTPGHARRRASPRRNDRHTDSTSAHGSRGGASDKVQRQPVRSLQF